MAAFQVTIDEFNHAVDSAQSSKTFKERYREFGPAWQDHYFVHHGPLTLEGHFAAPGFYTLIIGSLTVDGFVDLDNPEGFDEGGLFIVIGDVNCTAFASHYGKCTFVDGNLISSDVVLNAYVD